MESFEVNMTLFVRKMALGWFLMVRHESGEYEVICYLNMVEHGLAMIEEG